MTLFTRCRDCMTVLARGDDYANDRCKTCAKAYHRSGGYSKAKRANKCKVKPAKWARFK